MACYTCFSLKKVVLLLIKCTTFVNTLEPMELVWELWNNQDDIVN